MKPQPKGLLQSAQDEEEPNEAPEGTPQDQAEDAAEGEGSGDVQASPEEQEMYDRVVTAGLKIIADKRANGKLVAMLERQGYKPEAIARAVVDIIMAVDEKMQGAIPGDVVVPAAQELADVLLDYLERIRKLGPDFDPRTVASVLARRLSEVYGSQEDDLADLTEDMSDDEMKEAIVYGGSIA